MFNAGTNDLASENNARKTAKSIVDLATSSVEDHCSSSIITRNDTQD